MLALPVCSPPGRTCVSPAPPVCPQHLQKSVPMSPAPSDQHPSISSTSGAACPCAPSTSGATLVPPAPPEQFVPLSPIPPLCPQHLQSNVPSVPSTSRAAPQYPQHLCHNPCAPSSSLLPLTTRTPPCARGLGSVTQLWPQIPQHSGHPSPSIPHIQSPRSPQSPSVHGPKKSRTRLRPVPRRSATA